MDRRSFIGRLGRAGLMLPVSLASSRMRAFAHASTEAPFMRGLADRSDNVLVLVRWVGGNDGLNTVVPYHDDAYYRARRRGLADDVSIHPEHVLPLPHSSTLGLHPAFAPILDLYREGKMAIVQNVGYEGQSFSHYRSMEIWLSGADADARENTGWYGRYLEGEYPEYPDVMPDDPFAIEFDLSLSLALIGGRGAMGLATTGIGHIPRVSGPPGPGPIVTTHAATEEKYVSEVIRQTNIFTRSLLAAKDRERPNRGSYPVGNRVGQELAAVARLVAAGLGTRLYIINLGSYDFHVLQREREEGLHRYFSEAVAAFQQDIRMLGIADRICLMTMSEFGRRVESNGSGTDHGGAAPLFVIGNGVQGGVIGNDPDPSDPDEVGNLRAEFDFRQVYASVLAQWYGATDDDIYPRVLDRRFDQLPIFRPEPYVTTVASTGALRLEQNHPNPASATTTIRLGGIAPGQSGRLTLSTMEGRRVAERIVSAGQQSVKLDLRALVPGTYIYELTSGTARRARTMTVIR